VAACKECDVGRADNDEDSTTSCVDCDAGRYADITGTATIGTNECVEEVTVKIHIAAWGQEVSWNIDNGENTTYCCEHIDSTYEHNPDTFEFEPTPLPFHDAEFMCTSKGGHLASVHSQADHELIDDLTDANLWIGLHDRHSEGCSRHGSCGHQCDGLDTGFIWTDGTNVDFHMWANGEPNDWNGYASDCSQASTDGGVEDCTEMKYNGRWNDDMCHFSKSYVCGYSGYSSRQDNEICGKLAQTVGQLLLSF